MAGYPRSSRYGLAFDESKHPRGDGGQFSSGGGGGSSSAGDKPASAAPAAGKFSVGSLVRFKQPGLNGPVNAAGTIKQILPDGRLDIKLQSGGYAQLNPADVSPPASGLDLPGTTPLNRSIHAALKKNAKPGKEIGFGEILRMLPPEISRKDAAAEISKMVDRREIEYTRRGNYKPIISDAAYEHFGGETKQAPSLKGQRPLFADDPDPTPAPAPEAEKSPRIEATRGGQKTLFARARNAARSILGV